MPNNNKEETMEHANRVSEAHFEPTWSTRLTNNLRDAWEATREHVGEASEAVAQHSQRLARDTQQQVSHQSQRVQEATRPVLQQAGQSLRAVADATQQQTRVVAEATQQKTRALSMATTAAALTKYQATKQGLESIGSNPLTVVQGETIVKGEETDPLVTGAPVTPVHVLSAMGLVSGVVSFWLVVGHVVDLASLTLILLAPLVAVQKTKLRNLGGLRGQQNRLRASVNRLTRENAKLSASVTELQGHVQRLQKVESQLQDIAKKSGHQVDQLVDIVHENGEVMAKVKQSLQAAAIQQILTVVVQTDRNQDFTLAPNEVDVLMVRLANINGIDLDVENFKKCLEADTGKLTLPDVMAICRNLTDDDVPEEENIFHLQPRAMLPHD